MEEHPTIVCQVDNALLDEVEQESYRILLQQRFRFNVRWYNSGLFLKSTSLLRLAGIIFSLLGIFLCVFYLAYPSSCPKWFFAEIYLLAFIIFAVFFWYLPQIEEKITAKLKTAGKGGARKMARRSVAKARKCVPYTAEYSIKGDLLYYYRIVNKHRYTVWSRRLKGFVFVGKHTLLFFRKPTSFVPVMLILFENNEDVEHVLKQPGITFEKIY